MDSHEFHPKGWRAEEKETFSSRKQTGSARQTHSKAYPIRLALRYIFLQALRGEMMRGRLGGVNYSGTSAC